MRGRVLHSCPRRSAALPPSTSTLVKSEGLQLLELLASLWSNRSRDLDHNEEFSHSSCAPRDIHMRRDVVIGGLMPWQLEWMPWQRGWMPWQLLESSRQQESGKQSAILEDVRTVAGPCGATECPQSVEIHGKVLVWDIRYDKDTHPLSDADTNDVNSLLPRKIRASSSDRPITVFLIFNERDDKMGEYDAPGRPLAYRRYVDIAAAYWPEKKPAGCGSVISNDPSPSVVVSGPNARLLLPDLTHPIAGWIESLRRTP